MGLFGDIVGAGIDLLNYGSQREQQSWERKAYEETKAREDSEVQRRVADLRAAGLSPVLAAGQGASTSSPIHTVTPELTMNALTQSKDIAKTAAEKVRIEEEARKAKVETGLLDKQAWLMVTQADKNDMEVVNWKEQREWNKAHGLAPMTTSGEAFDLANQEGYWSRFMKGKGDIGGAALGQALKFFRGSGMLKLLNGR